MRGSRIMGSIEITQGIGLKCDIVKMPFPDFANDLWLLLVFFQQEIEDISCSFFMVSIKLNIFSLFIIQVMSQNKLLGFSAKTSVNTIYHLFQYW